MHARRNRASRSRDSDGLLSRRGFLRNVAGLGVSAAGLRWSQSLSALPVR